MSNSRTAAFIGSLIAVAACSDGITRPAPARPSAPPSFDMSALAEGVAVDAATGEAVGASLDVGVHQAATGGRASGHAEVLRVFTTITVAERYSFIALTTGPMAGRPFAAKGEFSEHLDGTLASGAMVNRSIHADITCLRILGNTAVASGPVERFVADGQPVNFPPGLQVLFTVQDNGEGRDGMFDLASPMALTLTAQGRPACEFLTPFPLPNENSNIQVLQK